MTVPTGTSTATTSLSLTSSISLAAQSNYSMNIEPSTFVEGQEFRVQLKAILEGATSTQRVKHFNVTDLGKFEVRLYTWSSTTAEDCATYASSGTLLDTRDEFGMTRTAAYDGERWVEAAHVTFPAPVSTAKFVVCFKHTLDSRYFKVPSTLNGQWSLFTTSAGQYVFQSSASTAWYYLPEPTVGQYAILQLLSTETSWNFTYAPSTCVSNIAKCGLGDNLKIVPTGQPCTYEYQAPDQSYLGSTFVEEDGSWGQEALDGLKEGATAGGVGVFGTQFANPLVDAWSSSGSYFPANDENYQGTSVVVDPAGGETRHAYVYVRLPQTVGNYDVCFSSNEQRISWRTGNATVGSVPMWRKLYRCTTATACATNDANTYFTAAAEKVGWHMHDVSPGTWGEIVFDDSGEKQLSSYAATSTVIVSTPVATKTFPYVKTTTANYWAPSGGDYFKIVSSSSFTETTSNSRVHPYTSGARLGSMPSVGCWSRALDVASSSATPANHGGYVEDGARYPIGSRDLTGDPTVNASTDNAGGVSETYSTLYVPPYLTRWHVCYRRTCTFTGASCAKYSGFRVLPFHRSGVGSTPTKWLRLNALYTPGTTSGPHHELVPAMYDEERNWGTTATLSTQFEGYPPTTRWYMNDTRQGSWGPLIVEKYNHSEPTMLDSRPWNFVRASWGTTDKVTDVTGSTLRLVLYNRPCDYPGFTGHTSMGAKNEDGGMVECNSADAEKEGPASKGWRCAGSSSNVQYVTNVAFYITVPDSANYRVCYRLKGWNWRELSASSATGELNDPSNPMPRSSLARGDWTPPSSWFTPTSSALTHLTLAAVEDRSQMEALFLITDTQSGLSAAPRLPCPEGCEASGDVLRLVPMTAQCDVNPTNWVAAQADTHLSLYCATTGSGATTTSGLYYTSSSTTPCSLAKPTVDLCGGSETYRCNSTNAQLSRLVAVTPDLYDDVVPHDHIYYNYKSVAAVLPVPVYNAAGGNANLYKVCYKQMGTSNWAVFNDTWEVKPGPGFAIGTPTPVTERLVGGELKKFELSVPSSQPFAVNTAGTSIVGVTFYAKLILEKPGEQNANCVDEAGSTEAQHLAGATTSFALKADGTNRTMTFFLTVPQKAGKYALCVQVRRSADDSMSWWRAGGPTAYSYIVLDNGIRWFITAGNQPTNQGLSVVKLVRCTPSESGGCTTAGNTQTFNTDPGKDAGKIVAATSACSDGASDKTAWGTSVHVGIEGGEATGRTNLGPADGPADVAELRTTLPAVASDAQVDYKVCVYTVLPYASIGAATATERRWVEVAQASSLPGQLLVTGADGRPAFRTAKGLMHTWTLESGLRPAKSLFTGPSSMATVGLAGASTQYVTNPTSSATTTAATTATGFYFNSYANLVTETKTQNEFKLVAAAKPAGRVPDDPAGTTWGTVANWDTVPDADCMGPAVDAASNLATCTDPDTSSGSGVCPQLEAVATATTTTQRKALFHIPVDTGKYLVCYRVSHTSLTTPRPWLMLSSSAATSTYALYSHPSFLEMEVGTGGTNVTVVDVRVANLDTYTGGTTGQQFSVSSWCSASQTVGEGTPCSTQNNAGFTADLLTVVNDTQVCPAPPVAPAGSSTGPPQWFQLIRTTNTSAAVSVTWAAAANALALPPASYPSASGQYKICVYKAGEATRTYYWNASSEYVAKQGVVYQLYNRGSTASGGGSGYWRDISGLGAASKLLVTSDVAYNASTRFTEFTSAAALEALYGSSVIPAEQVTDEYTQTVSRTPLLRSGTTVQYTVQVGTSDNFVLPLGSHAVAVQRCAQATTFAGLECASTGWTGPDVSPGEFIVHNVGGRCNATSGPMYGWPTNGLRQFMVEGQVTFNLQYRSKCPAGEFGCGVRFSADSGALMSPAQWVNVAEHWPDDVALDGVEVLKLKLPSPGSASGCSSTSTDCYLKECWHGKPCKLRIQARWNGPSEFAPNGTLALLYARQDYAGWTASTVPAAAKTAFGNTISSTAPLVTGESWKLGGWYDYTFTPFLESTTSNEAYLYLNVTYGEKPSATSGWTRMVVKVTRSAPSSVSLTGVLPVDVPKLMTAGRSPAPGFAPTEAAITVSGVSLQASEGSYLEALVPYVASYMPKDSGGKGLPQVSKILNGWSISGKVSESTSTLVLHAWAEDMLTDPKVLLAHQMTNAGIGGDASFRIYFRVYAVDNACSRFATNGGCTVVFTFSHSTLTSLEAKMITPVRVPASTVMVTTSTGSLSSTVREGHQVSVYPGTYVVSPGNAETFVYDEFHYGDVFALLEGPAPADGATNRDGVVMEEDSAEKVGCAFGSSGSSSSSGCAVAKYRTKTLTGGTAGTRWGASFMMRPDKPCNLCEFTFHTTLGAGPQSHYLNNDGSQRGVYTMTWKGENVVLACADATVLYTEGAAASAAFALTVTAGVEGQTDANARYPKWWVFTNTSSSSDVVHTVGTPGLSYALEQTGVTSSVLTSRMVLGVATFKNLMLLGSAAPATGVAETVAVTFHAIGLVYDTAVNPEAGARPTSTKEFTCTSTVTLESVAATAPTTSIQLVSVTGGVTSLCSSTSTSVCTSYQSTVSDFSSGGGMTVEVQFVNTSADGTVTVDTTTVRNATIVPVGGPSTSPRNAAPSWTYDSASSTYTSGDIVIDSVYNPSSLETLDGNEYTFGKIDVLAKRTRPVPGTGSNLENGRGSVTLEYGKTATTGTVDQSPVRQATFMVCSGSWDGTSEVTGTGSMCLTLSLWILPTSSSGKAVVWTEPSAGAKIRGTGGSCGVSPTQDTLTVTSYFTVSTVASTTTRFWLYNVPVEYQLSVAGKAQYLVMSGGTEQNQTLWGRNGVASVGSNVLQHGLGSSSLKVTFQYYGRDVVSTEKKVEVSAVDMSGSGTTITAVSTTNAYTWKSGTETLSSWSLATGGVTLDEECPSKRYLQSVTTGYRTFTGGVPGLGWDYAKSGGAVVGVPFPIETVVLTTAQKRAWTFTSGILVKATKSGWSGCNDGGTLQVYSLKRSQASDKVALRKGQLASSFELGTGGAAVPTVDGVGTLWPVFSAPCQACTLQLDLCYSGKTDATCLEGLGAGSTDPSDATPLFADRTKLTKQFSVEQGKTDLVEVHGQTLPTPTSTSGGRQTITVGEMFHVEVANVQLFGHGNTKWAMEESPANPWKRTVWVRSRWVASATERTASAEMRYGNGGFLHDGSERLAAMGGTEVGCAAMPAETEFVASVEVQQWASSGRGGKYGSTGLAGATSGFLNFFFVRPCSRCEVWLDYSLAAQDGTKRTQSGMIALRSYATAAATGLPAVGAAPLQFMVKTCAEGWLLSGTPAVAVRRRRPFGLTVVRADRHNVVAWEGTSTASLTLTQSVGNGGGGVEVVTSPLTSGSSKAVDGSATVRVFMTRACYQCSLTFGGKSHGFTVLTDATQVVAVPLFPMEQSRKLFKNSGEVAEWTFEVYAADDLGDRAYTVAGPTEFAMQPMYSTYNTGGGSRRARRLSLTAPTAWTGNVLMSDAALTLGSLSSGLPTMKVTNGTRMHNGIPIPSLNREGGALGTATVQASGDVPGVGYALRFAVEQATVTTSFFGEKMAAFVDWTAVASRMAVDDPERATGGGCTASGMAQGSGSCTFSAYAVARSPAASEADTKWYLSTSKVDGPVTAAVDCGTCGTAELTPAEGAEFDDGEAEFELALKTLTAGTAACSCTVTVTPPAALEALGATAQTFTVSYAATELSVWKWGVSDTLATATGSQGATAQSVANRTVALPLFAMDSTETYSGIGGLAALWTAQAVVLQDTAMEPTGCFVCASVATTADGSTCQVTTSGSGGDAVTIAGVFPDAGTCTIQAGAFSGLPTAAGTTTSPLTSLTVTVEAVYGVEVMPDPKAKDLVSLSNFTNLEATTLLGMPAAVAGSGSSLTLRVVDAAGATVTGDNHMQFTLTGRRVELDTGVTANGTGSWAEVGWGASSSPSVAEGGYVTFELDVNGTTRAASCENYMGSGMPTDCVHTPWFFTVRAVAPESTDGVSTVMKEVAVIQEIGPLYFVRRAEYIVVLGSFSDPVPPECFLMEGEGEGEGEGEEGEEPNMGNNSTMGAPGNNTNPKQYLDCELAEVAMEAAEEYPWLAEALLQGWVPVMDEEAMWGYGFEFGLRLYAVDEWGVLTWHPEDSGSNALVTFRPLAVPCLNVDLMNSGNAVLDTCIDLGGQCLTSRKVSSLAPCTQTGSRWSVSTGPELGLMGGYAEIPTAKYGGSGSFGGPKRFKLTTADPGPWVLPQKEAEDAAFVYQITMQETSALVPLPPMDPQEIMGMRGSGDPMKGPLSGCKSKSRKMRECPPPPREMSPEPLMPFNMTIGIVDEMGRVVFADSESNVTVSGKCLDPNTTAFFGFQLPDGTVDYVKKPVFKAHKGVIFVDGLVVGGLCENMTLSFVCGSGSTDTLKTCQGLEMTTLPFPIAFADPNMTLAPYVPPEPVTASVSLGSFDTIGAVLSFAGALNQDDAGNRMKNVLLDAGLEVVKSVLLTFVCGLEAGAKITAQDKLDPAVCINYLATPAPPATNATNTTGTEMDVVGRSFLALQATALVSAVSEFEVELGVQVDAEQMSTAVSDAIVSDLNSPSSTLRAAGGSGPSPFANADASSVSAGVAATPEPTTVAPPTKAPPTRAPPPPPTPEPPATPQPPTTPSTPTPPAPLTPEPPATPNPDGEVPVPLSGSSLVPSLAACLVATLLAVLLL